MTDSIPDPELLTLVLTPSVTTGKSAASSLKPLVNRVVDGKELDEEMHDIRLALTEAIANVMDHALDEGESTPITMKARVFLADGMGPNGSPGLALEICLVDNGRPPETDRFISRDPDDVRSGGLGLRLIAQVMDRVEMRIRAKENSFRMIRYLGRRRERHATQDTFHVLRRETAEGCELFLYGCFDRDRAWKIDIDELVSMRVKIDLSGLSSIDAAGIQEILALAGRLKFQGSVLEVTGIRDNIRRSLTKCGLLDRLAWGEAKSSDRSRVLLVERDPLIMRQVRKSIDGLRVDLRFARDILAVQNEMQRHRPDLVILSMDLPFGEGDDLFWSIRSDPAWATVPLILTGRGSDFAARYAAMQEDVDDFCPIPMDTSELTFRIRHVLDRHSGAPGSLSLLRALGRRFEPELLAQNIADQIDKLQDLNTFFLGSHRSSFSSTGLAEPWKDAKVAPRLAGWMNWGPLSLGSFFRMEAHAANGSCVVVLGRGVKSGISSVIAASHVAGLAALAIENCPDDMDAIAAGIASHARRLVTFVDPYFIAFARFVPDSGWILYAGDGPNIGFVRGLPLHGAERKSAAIGSFSVDSPPRALRKTVYAATGPSRFLAPGFGLDVDRIWELPTDDLRKMRTNYPQTIDFWVADIC